MYIIYKYIILYYINKFNKFVAITCDRWHRIWICQRQIQAKQSHGNDDISACVLRTIVNHYLSLSHILNVGLLHGKYRQFSFHVYGILFMTIVRDRVCMCTFTCHLLWFSKVSKTGISPSLYFFTDYILLVNNNKCNLLRFFIINNEIFINEYLYKIYAIYYKL